MAALTGIGVLYFWPDIQGLPEAYPKILGPDWEATFEAVDREVVAYVLLGMAILWIFWIDARPYILEWWGKGYSPSIKIGDKLFCETQNIRSNNIPSELSLHDNIYYLPVYNGLDTGETLRNVQARIFHLGPPTQCKLKGMSSGAADIRHGERVYFEIGRVISEEMIGLLYSGPDEYDGEIESYVHNIPRGHKSFDIHPFDSKQKFRLGYFHGMDSEFSLLVVVSADETKASRCEITVKFSEKSVSVTVSDLE